MEELKLTALLIFRPKFLERALIMNLEKWFYFTYLNYQEVCRINNLEDNIFPNKFEDLRPEVSLFVRYSCVKILRNIEKKSSINPFFLLESFRLKRILHNLENSRNGVFYDFDNNKSRLAVSELANTFVGNCTLMDNMLLNLSFYELNKLFEGMKLLKKASDVDECKYSVVIPHKIYAT